MRVHFIAIGGSAMHNLALALHDKGHKVTGSDDEIFEPSLTRLEAKGLLPAQYGWFPEKISAEIEAVILGMHARLDNPELLKAQELGLKIYSFPDYIYQYSQDKQRVVIAGSHGKTTVTSMIMHVLKFHDKDFDYMVGSLVEGFDTMTKLSDAPVIVIEGDEYLTSPLDPRPKFAHYKHHIGVITGIAWDHINVFPTFANYLEQFETFADLTPKGGNLIYCKDDKKLADICSIDRNDVRAEAYTVPSHKIRNGKTVLNTDYGPISLQVFGEHNLKNIEAARLTCQLLGVTEKGFYTAISSFKGAANRLELLAKNDRCIVFKDFAHAPSKVLASTMAVKKNFSDFKLVACLELHTFSSLSKEFLKEYKDKLKFADDPIVFFSPQTVEHKKLTPITESDIQNGFATKNLKVFSDKNALQDYLLAQKWDRKALLMMSSGKFDGINLPELAKKIVG
jgi:UDP-N-acetylmuramate: L-alanyl-gamma-D-glutamyl-meso-diaminopimelate ligase